MNKDERIRKLEQKTNALFYALSSLASMIGYQVRSQGNSFYAVTPNISGSDTDRLFALADFLGVQFRSPVPSARRVCVEKKKVRKSAKR